MSDVKSRCAEGGFAPRYRLTRTDCEPIHPRKGFFVLEARSGADPAARFALRFYALLVSGRKPTAFSIAVRDLLHDATESRKDITANPLLARDLFAMLNGVWPPEFAQHADAE